MFARSILRGRTVVANMTSKRGGRKFYKGRGAPRMGRVSKHGKFLFDREKFDRDTFLVPDLTGFPLKAYVSRGTPRIAKESAAATTAAASS